MDYKEEDKWQMGDLGALKINPFAFQLFAARFKFLFQPGRERMYLDHQKTTKLIRRVSNFVRLFKM